MSGENLKPQSSRKRKRQQNKKKSTYIGSIEITEVKSVPERNSDLSYEEVNGTYKVRSELLKDLLQRKYNIQKNNKLNFKDTSNPDFLVIKRSFRYPETFDEFQRKLTVCKCIESTEGLKESIMNW